MKYKFFPHTADVKFQAYGKKLKECFENSALALTNIMYKKKVKSVIRKKFTVKSKDIKGLLYDFLSELIFYRDVDDFIISDVKVEILGTSKLKKRFYKLTAELRGDDLSKYKTELDVKAITYYDMFVKQENGRFICQVVVDI